MANAYTPAANSVASRVVAWLQARPSGEYNAAQIGEALNVDPKAIAPSLEVALREKLVFHRQRDRTSPRAPWWYSATDREAHARRNGFAAAATWMPAPKKEPQLVDAHADSPVDESAETHEPDTPQGDQAGSEPAREVMEPEACESAAGRGTNGAPALATLPQHASPGVGPMGAGQPADAGPTTDQRSGGVEGHAAASEARAYSKAIPTALDNIPSMRPEGVPPGGTQSQGSRAAGVESGTLHQSAAQQGNLNPVTDAVEPAAPAALPLQEERREVDAQFAASLRAAMHVDVDDDCLARGAELGRRKGEQLHPADLAATRRAVHAPAEAAQPLAFRAARYSDGTLATERDGIVVAVYSAAEVDAIQKLLGART